MIRAAFFDIDGTLVSMRTHEIPASAVRALEALHRRGVLLFIATGRASSEIPTSVRALDARLPFDGFLTFNGQYCYDAAGVSTATARSTRRTCGASWSLRSAASSTSP